MAEQQEMVRREETQPEQVREGRVVAPRVDIYENKDEILLFAEMPGVLQDEARIHLNNNELLIEARRYPMVNGNPLRQEFYPYDYRRTFTVPQGIDADKIQAKLKNGVLELHLPKSEALKPRQISIQTG